MPWFEAKPYSANWGYHWTLNRFNPDIIDASGQREIGSHYYPLIGPYDSLDPAVLEYHVLLMKLAGIDGAIVDWYGNANFADYAMINNITSRFFSWTRRAGLKFAICYEDQTIGHMIDNKFITADQAISEAQSVMRYLQANYFNDASYFKLNATPVLLNFGPEFFKTNADWQTIFSVLPQTPAFFTENTRLPVAAGAFEWPPMWKSVNGILSLTSLRQYLTGFETSAKSWPASTSGAFPRFYDDYAQSLGVLADNNGATFQETLRRSITNRSTFVQIVTWNDFGEGTIVEPTVEFGFRDLGVIQDQRRTFIDPSFAYTTNDLNLAFQIYSLRRANANNTAATAELNRAFTNVVEGRLEAVRTEFSALEAKQPLIENVTNIGGDLVFSVGGYLANTGAVVQVYSQPNPQWQNLETVSSSLTEPAITNHIGANPGPVFFRVVTGP